MGIDITQKEMPGHEQAAPEPGRSDPQVRVVDRRWWVRQDDGEAGGGEGPRKPTYVEDLERQIAEQAARLQSWAADHRRSVEEFEQAKARMRRDVAREVERGRRSMLVELLEVVDNLDRAIAAARGASDASDAFENLRRGIELVHEQFLAKLAAFGITRVQSLGMPFDAARHEAITTAPVADPSQDGLVVAVIKEGYAVGEEILRPASVVVGVAERTGETHATPEA